MVFAFLRRVLIIIQRYLLFDTMLSKFVPPRLPRRSLARYLQSTFQLERDEIAKVLYDCIICERFAAPLSSDVSLCERAAALLIARQDHPRSFFDELCVHGVASESMDNMQIVALALVDVIQNSDDAGFQRIVAWMNSKNIWSQTPRLLQMIRQNIEVATCALPLLKVPSRYIWQRLYQTFSGTPRTRASRFPPWSTCTSPRTPLETSACGCSSTKSARNTRFT